MWTYYLHIISLSLPLLAAEIKFWNLFSPPSYCKFCVLRRSGPPRENKHYKSAENINSHVCRLFLESLFFRKLFRLQVKKSIVIRRSKYKRQFTYTFVLIWTTKTEMYFSDFLVKEWFTLSTNLPNLSPLASQENLIYLWHCCFSLHLVFRNFSSLKRIDWAENSSCEREIWYHVSKIASPSPKWNRVRHFRISSLFWNYSLKHKKLQTENSQ